MTTFRLDGEAAESVAILPGMIKALCHSAGAGWRDVPDLEDLSDLRAEPGNLLWVEANVSTLGDDDLETLTEEFQLNHLAVKDAAHVGQRPKLVVFPGHLFVVVHELVERLGQLEAAQIACFLGDRFVLTIHDDARNTLEEAKERWPRHAQELGRGSAYLLYTLLDIIVENCESLAFDLEDQIEELEEIALEAPNAPIRRQLYAVRQRVARLRRYAFPAARILDWLQDPQLDADWPEETASLFRHVHDQILRVIDEVRSIDDLSQAVLELQRSEQAASLSNVNKKLTAWAAIIATPTFIASVYGMNFELVPRSGSMLGFWFALVLMAVVAGALYWLFKKKRWL